ncbi:ribosome biogenesis GTPase YqeH [Aerococcus urinae]|uniref:ribosome biogenesis GTPase YqeH n=1 Tax=Aerococcus urinae TaxID=1376 RepID=UPI00255040B1|nr:ribosome biogenesis GTPase YqeH [Aerococcus urinae]MDK7715278.1 ribosome biogenesis GTPase YqeH [Aerococcus urinae]
MTEEVLYCIGCGAGLQTDQPKERGYTPKSAYDKGVESGELYCKRCFKLRHYNQLEKVQMTPAEFRQILHEISEDDALIVNVIDIFDVQSTIIPALERLVGNNDIVFVANKVDLLPSDVKSSKIEAWLKKYLKDQGFKARNVFLTSAVKNKAIDDLFNFIDQHRKGRNVYIVGVSNVGKSTLINSMLRAQGFSDSVITTSQFPGTTLDLIKIPFDEDSDLIDTPGILKDSQMTSLLDYKSIEQILPQKRIKPRTFQLNPGQSLFLGGMARFDYLAGDKQGVTVYLSNQVDIHRRKTEGSDEFLAKHQGGLLTPPSASEVEQFPDLVGQDYTIKESCDLVIAGLGWLSIKKTGKVAIYAPKTVDIFQRKPLI